MLESHDAWDLEKIRCARGGRFQNFFAQPRRDDWNKAIQYLTRIKSGALARRFGWLIDHAKAEVPHHIRERVKSLTGRSTRAWLGASPEHKVHDAIGYDKTWRLFVNVAPEELHGSAGMGWRKAVRKDR